MASDVPEGKHHSIFLTCCGTATYRLLQKLLKSETPQEQTLNRSSTFLGNITVPCCPRLHSISASAHECAAKGDW